MEKIMMRHPALRVSLLFLIALLMVPFTASAGSEDELDSAKWKLYLSAWISSPTGYFNGSNNNGYFDLQRDFGFGNYVTFSGKFDWRFKRKHHLLFSTAPVVSSRTSTLNRTVEWQGDTFDVGAQTNAEIKSLIFSPGYEYDFFRKRRGFLGVLVNVNLAYTDARLKLEGNVSGSGGSGSGSVSSEGSVFAPLPAIGPTFRWYPIPDSPRLYLDGNLTGMSFFGYGNFISAGATVGFPISHSWDVRAGYLMGSRLKIEGSSDQIAIRLTQKGAVIGVEYHWGTR
jgi:hypothetical protein